MAISVDRALINKLAKTASLQRPYNIKVEDPSGTRDKVGTVPEIEGQLEPMVLCYIFSFHFSSYPRNFNDNEKLWICGM